MGRRAIRVIRESAGDPALDTAVSRVLLERVAEGGEPETLRLYTPQPNVAFGRQDTVVPGYREAVRAARAAGFEPVERLAGGRAAVYHEGTVALAWALPDTGSPVGIRARFDEVAGVVIAALRSLGVDARCGEVPGEWCPGEYSVNAAGRRKLMGVGQRIIRGAAHVGGVVVVRQGARVRDVLLPVYEALAFPWDPATVGAVEDEIGPTSVETVTEALLTELAARHDLEESPLPADVLDAARPRRSSFLP